MSLVLGIQDISAAQRPSVVSIGNFDGVHLGHQAVVQQLLKQSRRLQLPSVVVTFDPLAKEFFAQKSNMQVQPARLTTVEHRADLLMQLGIDYVCCLRFDEHLAQQSADDFIQQLLVSGLQTRYLVVGDDFRFGHKRQGDFDMLKQAGKQYQFDVSATSTFLIEQQRVSSGRVRQALADNDYVLTERLLGRPFSIAGTVSRGRQLGQTIGFPTANIELPDCMLPVHGVFAVKVALRKKTAQPLQLLDAIANIGNRPTVDGQHNRLEVHIMDIDKQLGDTNLYGEYLEVYFVNKIRDEIKFANLDDLQQQITADVQAVRAQLASAE